MSIKTTSASFKKRDPEAVHSKSGTGSVLGGLTKAQIMQRREDNIKMQTLQRQVVRMREEREREAEELKKKIKDLEDDVERMKSAAEASAEVNHVKRRSWDRADRI